MAKTGYVALCGEFPNALDLNAAARKFGWSARHATGSAIEAQTPLLAVLIHPKSLGMPWRKALELIQAAAPGVPTVICHELDELDSQREMITSGAFYTLLLPADPRELRFMLSELGAPLVALPNKQEARARRRFFAQVAGAA